MFKQSGEVPLFEHKQALQPVGGPLGAYQGLVGANVPLCMGASMCVYVTIDCMCIGRRHVSVCRFTSLLFCFKKNRSGH